VVARFPWARDKTYFLGWFGTRDEIRDPYNMGVEDSASLLQEMADAVEGLLRRLSPALPQSAAAYGGPPQQDPSFGIPSPRRSARL
jgi:hypothetical protein